MQMTDLDLLTRERYAAAHLRDAMMRLLGRMEHQVMTEFEGTPAVTESERWLRDRMVDLKEALDMHKDRRDDAGFSATSWAPKGS